MATRLQSVVCDALDTLFVYTAQQNIGPTRTTRIYYMWFHALASSYNWIKPKTVYSTKDNWDWKIHYLVWQPRDISIWITCTLLEIMPRFVPSYDPTQLLASERKYYMWSQEQQQAAYFRVKNLGRWKQWLAAWTLWFENRQKDGSEKAVKPPPVDDLPNGTLYLAVNQTIDPNTFPNPDKWTPLQIGTKKQSYLTYNWLDVRSAALSSSEEDAIFDVATPYFPNEPARKAEIEEIVSITGSLTDSQKIQAEFWAGGPYTISPPGMFLWFWKTYIQMLTKPVDLDTFFFSGLDLALHLFETGRIVWGLKKFYMQARPIQEIRRFYRGTKLIGYDGNPVKGESWIPYQEANFVTPPFADFPSGHSAFSQVFALAMIRWFGINIKETQEKDLGNVKLLCPMLETQIEPFGNFVIKANSSDIQKGIVPSQDTHISWSTWQEMADSAGLSRKYGGIHCISAHTSSQAIAKEIHMKITDI